MGNRKVPITKVIEAVKKWIAGEGSQRSLAAEIGIDSSTFRTYLARYRNSGILRINIIDFLLDENSLER